jgi:hypothetical protein
MSDTSQRGLMSHTAILNRLVQLEYEVLLPWADYLGYDLAYYVTEEHRSFGFFVHQESHLVRVQCKTARLISDGQCLEFNTLSSIPLGRGLRDLRAERVGVEPTEGLLLHLFSKQAH